MFADGSPSRTKLLIFCCTGTALVVRFTDDEMYSSGLSTQEEVAANSLAADILMPRPLLAEHIKKWGTDVCVLARFFSGLNRLKSIAGSDPMPEQRNPFVPVQMSCALEFSQEHAMQIAPLH